MRLPVIGAAFIPLLGAALTAALYASGLRALWRRAGRGRGVAQWRAAAFAAGLVTLAAALALPLGTLFATHMAQHMLLSVVAAPLLVLGAPLLPLLWALPLSWRRALVPLAHALAPVWRWLTGLPLAVALYVAVFWLWHVPALYGAALRDPAVHALSHASYLMTGLLFWWALGLGGGAPPRPTGVLALFLVAVQNSALSALILAAPAPWFAEHAQNAYLCNLTPLEDQRLAGLVMMLPCDAVYVAAALGLGAVWLRRLERQTALAETRAVPQ